MNATYTKLKDESWGVRAIGVPTPGSVVEVRKQSGEVKDEVIDKVLWQGKDQKTGATIALCSIQRHDRPSGKGGGREMCAECGERVGTIMCSDSSGLRALCCPSCARGGQYNRSFA